MAENEAVAVAKEYAGKVRGIMDTKAIYLYGSTPRVLRRMTAILISR